MKTSKCCTKTCKIDSMDVSTQFWQETEMIVLKNMEKIPECMTCRFRVDSLSNGDMARCEAQRVGTEPVHWFVIDKQNPPKGWRDPGCPLAEYEDTIIE